MFCQTDKHKLHEPGSKSAPVKKGIQRLNALPKIVDCFFHYFPHLQGQKQNWQLRNIFYHDVFIEEHSVLFCYKILLFTNKIKYESANENNTIAVLFTYPKKNYVTIPKIKVLNFKVSFIKNLNCHFCFQNRVQLQNHYLPLTYPRKKNHIIVFGEIPKKMCLGKSAILTEFAP